jgi:hypothetical protein
LLKQARRAICWNEPMPYFLQLTRIRENRLKVQCNETGTNYSAFMLLDTWSGQRGASPEDYRGKGWKYPVTINIQNENGEILSTTVL